ncbi:MAG: T9SS type A sorting domain-containing protein [Ignavibacteria bacterium]|jgi:hypothetical protein
MKKMYTFFALLTIACLSSRVNAQDIGVEITYTGGQQADAAPYSAVRFFSQSGKFSSDDSILIVADTKLMEPLSGDGSMNGKGKCIMHSGASDDPGNYWKEMAKDAQGNGQAWRDESVGSMTLVGNGIFALKIVPSSYYKLPGVIKIGMVFNDGNGGSAEGKAPGDFFITFPTTTAVRDGQGTAYDLSPVFPNPTSNTEVSMIRYRVLNTAQPIAVKVFDIRGNLVRTLVNEMQVPANYMLYWDKADANNTPVSAGSYIYTIESGSYRTSGTIIVNN